MSLIAVYSTGCKNKYEKLITDAPLLTVSIQDELGKNLQFTDLPKRIVSLSPGATELCYTLGAEAKLVGVSELCDFPPEVAKLPKVKITKDFASEGLPVVLELKPDCVIASDDIFQEPNQLIQLLAQHNIPVYFQSHKNLPQILQGIQNLGNLLDKKQEAGLLTSKLTSFQKLLADSTQNQIKYKCAVVVSYNPLTLIGGKHYVNQIIEAAGAKNLCEAVPETFFEVSADSLAKADPEFIFLITDEEDFHARLMSEHRALLATQASIKKQVFNLSPADCFRPTARLLDAYSSFTRALHPSVKINEIEAKVFETNDNP